MANYDFADLSPFDFEQLAAEIASKNYSRKFEGFTSGRDGGVDIRSITKNDTYIGQCKHYLKSSFSSLRTALKKEIDKAKKLNLTKYMVFTSQALTPENKDTIVADLSDLKLLSEDIWDKTQINNYLTQNPEIEKHHLKLFLNSTIVLDNIVHKEQYERSDLYLKDIIHRSKMWVLNSQFDNALKYLEGNNFCLISGVPGIGKTTMAELLCLFYIKNDYHFIKMNSLKDFFALLDDSDKQVFFYDDFLGDTKFSNNTDFDDLNLIIHSLNREHKMIFTTREYIFNQAIISNEKFKNMNLDKSILELKSYCLFYKAQILYNHLFYNRIKKSYCDYILTDRRYLKIIEHQNYSPRIIEKNCIDISKDKILSEKAFYKTILENLNNPKKIWDYAFKNDCDNMSRCILLSLLMLGGNLEYKVLKSFSYQLVKDEITEIAYDVEFKKKIYELENSFIKICNFNENNYLMFQNPSIKDYLEDFITTSSIMEKFSTFKKNYWNQDEFISQFFPNEQKYDYLNFLFENLSLELLPRSENYSSTYNFEFKVDSLIRLFNELNKPKLPSNFCKFFIDQLNTQKVITPKMIDNFLYFKFTKIEDSELEKLKVLFLTQEDICVLYRLLLINNYEMFISLKEVISKFDSLFTYYQTLISNKTRNMFLLDEYTNIISNLQKIGIHSFDTLVPDIKQRISEIQEQYEDDYYESKREEELFNAQYDAAQEDEYSELDLLFSSYNFEDNNICPNAKQ